MSSLIPLAVSHMDKGQQAYFQAGFALFAFGVGAALIVSLLGILYMTIVIAPNATQRFSGALRERNILSFFAGIPVAGVFTVLGGLFQNAPPLLSVTGLALGVMLILAWAAGAEDIGRRLFWACGKEGSRASHLASGWLVFAFGSLFPVIGWFVILPYVSLSGLGSLVVGAFPSKRAREVKDIEFPEK